MFIAAVGFADDLRLIPVLSRPIRRRTAVAVVIFAAAADLHLVPAVQFWIERSLLLVAGLWQKGAAVADAG